MRYMGWGYEQLRRCPVPEYLEVVAAIEREAKARTQHA